MVERPRFRRGIKFGRIRRIKEPIAIFRHERVPGQKTKRKTDEVIGTRNITIGYADSKTGKRLNAVEIAAFKAFGKARLLENLSKTPENSPSRITKNEEGTYVDRITNKPSSRNQILAAKAPENH